MLNQVAALLPSKNNLVDSKSASTKKAKSAELSKSSVENTNKDSSVEDNSMQVE